MSTSPSDPRDSKGNAADHGWAVKLAFGLVGLLVATSGSGAAFTKYLPGGVLGDVLPTNEISAAFAFVVTLPLALALTIFGAVLLWDERRGHARSVYELGAIVVCLLLATNFAGAAVGYEQLSLDMSSWTQVPGTDIDVPGFPGIFAIAANLLLGYASLYGWPMFLASVITASLCVYGVRLLDESVDSST